MARTAPVPNFPALPGMNPGIFIMGGGGDGGGSGAGGGKGGAGKQGASGKNGGNDATGGGKSAPDPGRYPMCGTASHPVDVVTGRAFTHPLVDFEIPGPIPLVWQRVCSSAMAGQDVGLGWGWAFSFGWSIEVRRRRILVWNDQGVATEFPMAEPGTAMQGRFGWVLWRDGDEAFRLDAGDGVIRRFAEPGSEPGSFRLSSVEDRNDNRVVLRYEAGRLTYIQDSAGRTLRVSSTPAGRIAAILVHNAASQGRSIELVRYTYDEGGHLIAATDADGLSARYAYDEDHRMISDTDRTGLTFHFVYDTAGRCIESWGDYPGRKDPSLSDGQPETLYDGVTKAKGIHHCHFEYHDDGSSDVVDSLRVRRFFGNAFGLLDKMVSGAGVTTATYREDGHMTSITDPMGGTTSYERDARGRVTRIADPLGGVMEIARDEHGDIVGIVDAAGAARTISRDGRGNVRSITDATGAVTSFQVDRRGLVTEIITPRGEKVSCAYDEYGNRTEIVVPGGAAWHYRYDFLGRRVEESTPTGAQTRYLFSDRGDLLGIRDPAGGTTRFTWDGERHVTSFVSQSGHTTRFSWGGYHRFCARTDAAGNVVRMRYDLEGRLAEVNNERGEVHRLEYDPSGLLIGERTFDGRSLRFKYDLAARLERIVTAPGEAIFLTRDAAGRLVEREFSDGNIERFEYDPCGRIIRVEGEGLETVFERDAEGRIIAERQTLRSSTIEVRSSLDGEGRRIARRTSLGHQEEVIRDGLGDRRRTILDGAHVIEHARDPIGREIARRLPGGARIESVHDAMGRLTRRRVISPATPAQGALEPAWIGHERGVVSDVAYAYDADSHIVACWEPGRGTTSYRYDPMGQLLAMVPEKAQPTVFRYDAAGNLYEDGADAPARAYGPGNRLERRGDHHYVWNEMGQLTAMRVPDGTGTEQTYRYEWNGAGLLSRVHVPGGDVIEMTYDPFARRLEKRVVRGRAVVRSTRFVWDREQIVQEITREAAEGGDPVIEERTYCFQDASFEPMAHRVRRGLDDPGRWVHYDNDVAGAPERLVDEQGAVVSRLRHAPWADTTVDGEAWGRTPLRYQGQYEDAETGLRYNRYRYYDPKAARFTSADPIGLRGGLNAFTYAPNPLEWVDPFGLARYPDSLSGRRTPDQQALIDMAQQEERRASREAAANGGTCTPMSTQDANAMIQLANGAGVPVRAKTNDITGQHGWGPVSPTPHIHVNGVHVPVPPGYTPPPGSTVITDSGPTTF